jgi:hypothetical protein
LIAKAPGRELIPVAPAEARGSMAGAAPWSVRHDRGRGSVTTMASNPLQLKTLDDPAWIAWFQDLAESIDPERNELWRFLLPGADAVATRAAAPGVGAAAEDFCLTGNSLVWDSNEPLPLRNAAVAGSYTYSLRPDHWPDEGGVRAVAFANGDLTDRLQAPTAGDATYRDKEGRRPYAPISAWAVRWNRSEAFTLSFDLDGQRRVNRIRIYYSGQMPDLRLSGSSDGASWEALARSESRPSTQDVHDLELAAGGGQFRSLRLEFGPREQGESLMLAEVEIWGLD